MPRPLDTADPVCRGPWALVVLLGAAATFGLTAITGCSSGAPPATSPPAASSAAPISAALCSAAVDFQTAANNLSNLDATKVGVDGVKAALQKLQTAGNNLAIAAKAQFGPDVGKLTTALRSLQNTVTSLIDQTSLSSKLGALTTSVSAVEQAAAPIMNAARAGCPSVPPTVLPSPS
jgi:hypothetical protein